MRPKLLLAKEVSFYPVEHFVELQPAVHVSGCLPSVKISSTTQFALSALMS